MIYVTNINADDEMKFTVCNYYDRRKSEGRKRAGRLDI